MLEVILCLLEAVCKQRECWRLLHRLQGDNMQQAIIETATVFIAIANQKKDETDASAREELDGSEMRLASVANQNRLPRLQGWSVLGKASSHFTTSLQGQLPVTAG